MAETLGLRDIRANALNTVGCARFQLGEAEGLADLERSIALATAANSPVVGRAYLNFGAVLYYAGELSREYEAQARGRQEARRFGQLLLLRFLEAHLREELYWTGRWSECEELARERIAELEQGGSEYNASGLFLCRGLIRLARGDTEGALADAQGGLQEGRRVRDPQVLEPALAIGARIMSAAGRQDEAASVADEALESWQGLGGVRAPVLWGVGEIGRGQRFFS